MLLQPRVLPGHRHPEPWAEPGCGDAQAESQFLPSTCMRMNCLSERRCIICYYLLSLKQSVKQEDRNIPNAWAELAVTGVALLAVQPSEYPGIRRQGWSKAGRCWTKSTRNYSRETFNLVGSVSRNSALCHLFLTRTLYCISVSVCLFRQ